VDKIGWCICVTALPGFYSTRHPDTEEQQVFQCIYSPNQFELGNSVVLI